MQLISIPLGRALGFVEWESLNLRGKLHPATMVSKIAEKCQFMTIPQEPKQFSLPDGVTFENGVLDGKRIRQLTIFPALIYVDGSDTEEARECLLDLLVWGKHELHLNYGEDSIRRWAYVSNVVIQSDISLLRKVNPILNEIGESVSELVRLNLGERLRFQPSKLYIGIDPLTRSSEPAAFSIQHRGVTPFEDQCYFCEAPIPTPDHLRLLEKLESTLKEATT
jgi:hypothetical protein